MASERNAFKLGLSLIAFFCLLVGVLVFLAPRGGGDMTVRVRYPHTQFNTLLKPGAAVTCGGKIVGAVRQLDLSSFQQPDQEVESLYTVVTMTIESSLDLRRDCRVVPEGLLLGEGGSMHILSRGVGEPVADGELLDGEAGGDVAALTRAIYAQLDPNDPASLLALVRLQLDADDARSLMAKIHSSLNDLNAVTASVNTQLNPRDRNALLAKLHTILDNVNDTTGLLRGQMDAGSDRTLVGKVHQALDGINSGLTTAVALLQDNRQPLTETIGHVRNTSEILEQQIARRIAGQLDAGDAASLIAKVHVAIDRLNGSLSDINTITDTTRQTIVLSRARIDGLIGNFKETSDHLKGASKEIRRNPWRLFYQPTVAEAAEANIFDAAAAFSAAAAKLDDAIGRLEAINAAGTGAIPAGDQQLTEIRDELRKTFDRFHEAEAALWDELKIR